MAVKPAAGGLPVNTRGTHTAPTPTPTPSPSTPTASTGRTGRQLARRRSGGRGQQGGAGK
jgi:hypothetical protein